MALSTTNALSALPLSSTLRSQFLSEPLPRFNMEKSLAHEAAYQYGRSETKTKRYTTNMAIVKTQPNKDIPLVPFGSRFLTEPLPRYEMPEKSLPKEAAYQIIHDELMLDGNPRFDLCTFVTTWMEEEADKLMDEAMSKNFIAMPEYPVTTELEKRCVNMIARLFNAPLGEKESAIGVSTIGSSEAIMLAGLALKRKWQIKMKAQGKPYDKPNLICGANVQVCWEKFCNYFEVEIRYVNVKEGYYIMDPQKAVDLVDENTICIAAILGSTYNGEYEDVKAINDLLEVKNKATGWDTPIHVDAASGGFVAPFITPDLVWDFKLPWVKSINVSGHKYGLVYAGVAWNIWRTKDDLPDELIFHINYLGDDQATFTLNFSKASSQVVAQYYNLVRLGKLGYKNIIKDCMTIAQAITDGVEKTGRFNLVSNLANGIPLVAFSLKDDSHYDVYTISDLLRAKGWLIPAYTMPVDAKNVKVLRAVIREDFSGTLVERFIDDLNQILKDLEEVIEKVTVKLGARGNVAREVKKEIARIWGDDKAEWKNKKTIAVC